MVVVKEKRRGSALRAFPDQGAASPGGADHTTKITKANCTLICNIFVIS